MLHGAPVQTFDLDIVYERSERNIERLLAALERLDAVYAGFEDKGVRPDARMLRGLGHHLLTTRAGRLDVLAFIADQQTFEDLFPDSVDVEVDNLNFRILSLDRLIALKRRLGREKDLLTAAMLETLRDQLHRSD